MTAPAIVEAGWCESGVQDLTCLLPPVVCLGFGGGDIAEGFEQALAI